MPAVKPIIKDDCTSLLLLACKNLYAFIEKWIVYEIPNVRKISCSPWSNKENFAANLRKDIIMSNKPIPSLLAATSFDATLVENDLRETREIAKRNGVKVEFLLKDISTIRNHPERLTEWNEIAMRVVENY